VHVCVCTIIQEEARDAIVDVNVTTGKAKDRTNTIHNPPVSSRTALDLHKHKYLL
jgi:hypothetical protein